MSTASYHNADAVDYEQALTNHTHKNSYNEDSMVEVPYRYFQWYTRTNIARNLIPSNEHNKMYTCLYDVYITQVNPMIVYYQ